MVLPESFLKCLSPEDRKSIGQMSAQEATEKGQIRAERDLQALIVTDLRRRGVEVLWHRTDKRSAATVGWPDITFAVSLGQFPLPCAWEIKLNQGRVSPEQEKMMARLQEVPNTWHVCIIRSWQEYEVERKALGL